MEIEDLLKAGHRVEPDSDIHVSAIASGAVARIDSRAVLVLIRERRFRLIEESTLFPFLNDTSAIDRVDRIPEEFDISIISE